MIIGYIVGGFIIYFLYKFIVGFIIPVVRTTTAVKQKMEQMRQPYQNSTQDQNKQREHSQGRVFTDADGAAANKQSQGQSDPKTGFGKFGGFGKARKFQEASQHKPTKSDYIEFEEIDEA